MPKHPTEEWRAVVGYEGWYSVSNLGRVRREQPYHNTHTGRLLSPSPNRRGYLRIALWCNDRGKTTEIHTLVAAAFLGPRPLGLDVNHKDGLKTNNYADNLEYVTRSENLRHALRLGLSRPLILRGSANGRAKLTEADVCAIRAASAPCTELAQQFKISRRTILHIRMRMSWKHLP